jgi:rare lipoprotein A
MRTLLAPFLVLLFVFTSLGAGQSENGKTRPVAGVVRPRPPEAKPKRKRPYQVGQASWYGKPFHGKLTASGEAYDMFRFTAAHPVLPLGTLVKVTKLSNGSSVIVRVNDRGPVPKSRIIDLSYGAAQILGLRNNGVARVRLDIVEPTEVAMVHLDAVAK